MKFIRFLKHEMARDAQGWIDDGILSSQQADQILKRYGTSLAASAKRSTGHFILASLAALFIGLALILVISQNWDEIPRAARLFGLIGLTASVNLFAIRKYIQGQESSANVSFFFGSLCYGASIFLIAQIYHLGEYFPDGIFYWALGVTPLVLLAENPDGTWGAISYHATPPKEGVFLRGTIQNPNFSRPENSFLSRHINVRYGIEAFFAPREKAMALEKELRQNASSFVAELRVAENGHAALVDVKSARDALGQ